MKNRPARSRLAWLLALAAGTPLLATLTPTEWAHRQNLTVTAPGLVRVDLPPATFDAAGPNQEDLRIIDPSGREVASLLECLPLQGALTLPAVPFEVKLVDGTTVITVTNKTKDRLSSIILAHPTSVFSAGRPRGDFRRWGDLDHARSRAADLSSVGRGKT